MRSWQCQFSVLRRSLAERCLLGACSMLAGAVTAHPLHCAVLSNPLKLLTQTGSKHRIEFSYATIVFLDPRRADLDVSRIEDGEVRRKVIGVVEGRFVTVVYTVRKKAIRIISA